MISLRPPSFMNPTISRTQGGKPASLPQSRPSAMQPLKKDTVSIRFGKVDEPAPQAFLNQYEKLSPQGFRELEEHLNQRLNTPQTLDEVKRQIPPGRDDAPGLDIVEVGEPYGKALRATKPFQKGDVVIDFNVKDRQTQRPAFYLAPLKDLHNSQPIMALSHYVVMTDNTALTFPKPQKISYLNHAEEGQNANVEVSYAHHGYVATKPIQKNDLIFSDYNTGEYRTAEDDDVFDRIHPFVRAANPSSH